MNLDANGNIRGFGLCFLLAAQPALAAHPVTIARAEPVTKVVHLTLTAEASSAAGNDSGTPPLERAYRLSIQLPNGATAALSAGSFAAVELPTIHHNSTRARIKSVSSTRVELVLGNQVQLLEGQRLKVVLPLKPVHLYRIPFQAIYSPRGLTTDVFILSPEKTARRVPVAPIQALPGGEIIVSSDHLEGASVVVQGTDNLLSGDGVRVIDSKGAAL